MAKHRNDDDRKDEDGTDDSSFAASFSRDANVTPMDRGNLAPVPTPSKGGAPDVSGSEERRDRGAASKAHETKTSVARATRSEMRELRAGRIRPQESIDLHGFTRDNAYRRLCNATARARADGKRCVVVVHGKGQRSKDGVAVLRDALDDWLGQAPLVEQVIGSCRAQPRDGGTGATYLLLRAPGKEKPAK